MESTASTPSIGDVVKNLHEIHVPDYQRTYSWEREQIEELFNDLDSCIQSGDSHFFGSLIIHAMGDKRADLVDGQQRLTTIFIIVATLRDELKRRKIEKLPAPNPNVKPIQVLDKAWNFLFPTDALSGGRFKSNRFINEMITNCVLAEPEGRPALPPKDNSMTLPFRKAVKEVRDIVHEDLKDLDDAHAGVRINEMLDALLNRFIVLQVTTGSQTESLDIFLTMNNRGLALGPSDLVRGQIMKQLSHNEDDKAKLKIFQSLFEDWKAMADSVHEPEVFLRHHLLATRRGMIRKKKVHQAVTQAIAAGTPELRKDAAKKFWDDLLTSADLYAEIVEPAMGGNLEYYLTLLEGFTKSHRILVLRLFMADLPSADLEELVRLTMVLSYRWMMSGSNAQDLETLYHNLSNDFADHANVETLKGELAKQAADHSPDVVRYLKSEGDSSFACRALIYATSRALTPDAIIKLDGELHLEHIAPQKATLEWTQALFDGDEAKYGDYDSTKSEIGNLTLLDKKINIKAKRKPFDEKKAHYDGSTMKITRDLCAIDEWTADVVALRNVWLAEAFEVLWAITPTQKKVTNFSEWIKTQEPT